MAAELKKIVNQFIFEVSNAAIEYEKEMGYSSEEGWTLLRSIPFSDLLIAAFVCLPPGWKEKPDIERQLRNILLDEHVEYSDENEDLVDVYWWDSQERTDDKAGRRIAAYAQFFVKQLAEPVNAEWSVLYKLIPFCLYWDEAVKTHGESARAIAGESLGRLYRYCRLEDVALMRVTDPFGNEESEKKNKFKELIFRYRDEIQKCFGKNDFRGWNELEQDAVSGFLNWRKP